MGYNGLLMGCARQYWLDILRDLRTKFGDRPFTWSEVYVRCPSITKSNLTRLKSSEWIKMVGKNRKTGMWVLKPGTLTLLRDIDTNSNVRRRPTPMVRVPSVRGNGMTMAMTQRVMTGLNPSTGKQLKKLVISKR